MGVYKYTSLSTLAMILIGALVACNSDEATNIVNEPTLQGRYIGPCDSFGPLGFAVREELEFKNAADFRGVRNFFQSGDCSGGSAGGAVVIEGSYQVDSDALPDSQAGAMTLEYESVKINLGEEWIVKAFNTAEVCGRDDYAINQEVEITQGTDNFLCPFKEVPETVYGAYTLDDDRLYINPEGLNGMTSSTDDRPTELDRSKVYVKE